VYAGGGHYVRDRSSNGFELVDLADGRLRFLPFDRWAEHQFRNVLWITETEIAFGGHRQVDDELLPVVYRLDLATYPFEDE
jgi:hypothetical protein